MEELPVTTLVGGAGLLIGIAFGAVTRRADFCALGALADMRIYGDYRRLRAWLMAIATAMAGTHLLYWLGLIDIHRSVYLSPDLGWFGAVFGGLLFGYGTVMARGCGGRSLIRLAGGDLRALVTLITLGIFAYMTLRGFTGAARVWVEAAANIDLNARGVASQGIPDLIGAAIGIDSGIVRNLMAVAVTAVIAWYCLANEPFRRSPQHLYAGIAIGLLISAGWAATGLLGADEFEPLPLVSMSFVRPIGDSLQYLMTFTGATISFGAAVVGGTLIGGFLVAVSTRTFQMSGFTDAPEMNHYLFGGALMGVGGVMALGCTIGQGVSGIATLSLGSLLAVAAIVVGGAIGISRLGLDTADQILGPAAGE